MNDQFFRRLSSSIWHCLLMVIGVALSTGCLATNPRHNMNIPESIQIESNTQSLGEIIKIDNYESVDAGLAVFLKEISPRLGLASLAESGRSEWFEFRLWTNLEARVDPKLLGVRSSGGQDSAYFFDIDRSTRSTKSHIEFPGGPKSGWANMLAEVRSRMMYPNGLMRDPKFDLSRDEPVILLEVFDKGNYRRVFYGKWTSFADGRRLIGLCTYLASEFDIDLDCQMTTP